jgi:hypothetical protein
VSAGRKIIFTKEGILGQGDLEAAFVDLELSGEELAVGDNAEELVAGSLSLQNVSPLHIDIAQKVSLIDPDLLKNALIKKILRRHVGGDGSLASDDFMGHKDQQGSSVLRVNDSLGLGSACDLVAEVALAERANFLDVRSATMHALTFMNYLSERAMATFPVSIECFHSEGGFAVQLSSFCEGVTEDTLWSALNPMGIAGNFGSSLWWAWQHCQVLEAFVLKRGEKICLTLAWEWPEVGVARGLLVREISEFEVSAEEEVCNSKVKLLRDLFELKEGDLPGPYPLKQTTDPVDASQNIFLVRRAVSALLDLTEKGQVQADQVKAAEIPALLDLIISKEEKKRLDDGDKKLVLNSYHDENLRERLEAACDVLSSGIGVDHYAEGIGEGIMGLSVPDIAQVLRGSLAAPDEKIVIPGMTDDLTEELWAVKRTDIKGRVDELLSDCKSSGASVPAMNKAVRGAFLNGLGIGDSSARALLSKLVDQKISPSVRDLERTSNRGLQDKIRAEKLMALLATREAQMRKMKSVIDSMRIELSQAKQGSGMESQLMAKLVEKDRQILLLNDRISTISANSERRTVEIHERVVESGERKRDEIERAVKIMTMLRDEKQVLEAKVLELERSLKLKEASLEISTGDDVEMQLHQSLAEGIELSRNLRLAEDEKKSAALLNKSLEQKVKFLTAQLDASRDQVVDSEGLKLPAGKQLEQRTVQLEKIIEQLSINAKRFQTELQEKKTEAYKLALENKAMRTRCQQLEKQMAMMSRKRSA